MFAGETREAIFPADPFVPLGFELCACVTSSKTDKNSLRDPHYFFFSPLGSRQPERGGENANLNLTDWQAFFSAEEILVLANRGQCSLSLVWVGVGREEEGVEVVGGLCHCGSGVNIPQKA